MTFDLALSLSGLSAPRAARAERILSLLPSFAEGWLLASDLGVRTAVSSLVGVLRFDPGAKAVLGRARFWCARAEVACVPMSTMSADHSAAFQRRFQGCDVQRRGIRPAALAAALREILSVVGVPAPRGPRWPPVLSLAPNGPGWEGFEYHPDKARLFIPSTLTPLVGDVLLLELRMPDAALSCRARVVQVRELPDAGPGVYSGFEVALGPDADRVRSVLAVRCAPRARFASGARSSPRFRVTAGAGVTALGEPAPIRGSVANLSQGGIFIRSEAGAGPLTIGTPLEATFKISDGVQLAAPGTVAHATEGGVGIRFERDEALLTDLLARLPGRPQRVLIIDDDALARAMLSDAFTSKGFEVLTAPDAMSGLQTLIDEMLTLDLLVTDVVMQGFDGVELLRRIRHDGNEADLPILAITATLTPELKQHLLMAGADAVVMKSIGPRLLVLAAEDVLAGRGSAQTSGRDGKPAVVDKPGT